MSWEIKKINNKNFVNGILLTKHKNVSLELIEIVFSFLRKIKFPKTFCKDLKEIRFTYLRNEADGYYYPTKKIIHISCVKENDIRTLTETIIHEVGHHVDRKEIYSYLPDVIAEWKKYKKDFDHKTIRKDPTEYFAIGFEKYFLDKNLLKKNYPILYKTIKQAIRKEKQTYKKETIYKTTK